MHHNNQQPNIVTKITLRKELQPAKSHSTPCPIRPVSYITNSKITARRKARTARRHCERAASEVGAHKREAAWEEEPLARERILPNAH